MGNITTDLLVWKYRLNSPCSGQGQELDFGVWWCWTSRFYKNIILSDRMRPSEKGMTCISCARYCSVQQMLPEPQIFWILLSSACQFIMSDCWECQTIGLHSTGDFLYLLILIYLIFLSICFWGNDKSVTLEAHIYFNFMWRCILESRKGEERTN
jgi:hypothetical protein